MRPAGDLCQPVYNLGGSWYVRAAQDARTRVWHRILAARECAARVDDAHDEEQQDAGREPVRAQVHPLFLHDGASGGNESVVMAYGRFYA